MTASMPWPLILAWVGFFGFLNTHQRHASNFQGSSQVFHLALNISVLLGCVVGLGLLIYYFVQVAWYWPIILFLIGSLVGGLLFGLLDAIAGRLIISLLAFIGWPVCAIWFVLIVRGLAP
jgi:hypothetical protein